VREFVGKPNEGETGDDAILTILMAAFEYAMEVSNDADPYQMADDTWASLREAGLLVE
jgi:hypothetical protein